MPSSVKSRAFTDTQKGPPTSNNPKFPHICSTFPPNGGKPPLVPRNPSPKKGSPSTSANSDLVASTQNEPASPNGKVPSKVIILSDGRRAIVVNDRVIPMLNLPVRRLRRVI